MEKNQVTFGMVQENCWLPYGMDTQGYGMVSKIWLLIRKCWSSYSWLYLWGLSMYIWLLLLFDEIWNSGHFFSPSLTTAICASTIVELREKTIETFGCNIFSLALLFLSCYLEIFHLAGYMLFLKLFNCFSFLLFNNYWIFFIPGGPEMIAMLKIKLICHVLWTF